MSNPLDDFIVGLQSKGYLPSGKQVKELQSKGYLPSVEGVAATVKDIGNRGFIPIKTNDRGDFGVKTALKAYSGPLGMPFKIEGNPDMDSYLQSQINMAKQVNGDKLGYGWAAGAYKPNETVADKKAGFAVGQWVGEVNDKGQVTTNDVWDFNPTILDYGKAALTGKGFGLDEMSMSQRGFYAMSSVGRALQDVGWLNQKPLGDNIVIGQAPTYIASR